MKMLFDFFPVLLFFIVYKTYDIYMATSVLIAASLLQTTAFRLMHGRFERAHLITLVLVCLFGGATLLLHDEMFIKWKPTVINWLFAAAFLGSQFIGNKNLIERMMGDHITLPRRIWSQLNIAWSIFFIFLGLLNLFVVYSFDTDTWVNFKLFGLLGLTFAFVIAQSLYIARHTTDAPSGDEPGQP